jgi:flagellar basal body-associated protein FliL
MLAKITGNKAILGAVVGIVGGLVVAVLLVVVLGVGSSPTPAAVDDHGVAKAPATTAKAPATAAKTPAKGVVPAGEAHAFGPTFLIKDRIVNLADAGGRRYLRFSVAIEFAEKEAAHASVGGNQLALYVPEADAAEYREVTGGKVDPEKEFLARIKKYTPAMEDTVTTVLSSKTSTELGSVEGKDAAKREIKDRIQRILGGEETVTNVYFTEFVMQ